MDLLELVIWVLTHDLFLKVLVIPGAIFVSAYVLLAVWGERKLLARVMLRIGPLHVGKYAGSLQVVADFIKLLVKERITPLKAHKALFVSMPVFGAALFMFPLAVIPFTESWVVFKHGLSLFFVLAAISLGPMVALLAGWAANSKYSFIGGLREAFQMIAYEVPLVLSVVGVVMLAGSLDLVEIVNAQSGYWFILLQPLGFILFFLSGLAEATRTPFDIPEAEQEIVAGWMTEYSGMNYGLCHFMLYERLLIFSLLVTELFLGGWHGPFLPPLAWLLIKVGLVSALVMVIRGAYPRFRMDQLLRIGWRVLVALAILNILITMVLLTVW